MKKIIFFQQLKALCVLMSLFFAFPANSAAQSIINGSFETPDVTIGNVLPGVSWKPANATWVFEGASIGIMKYGCAYAPPLMPDGLQCAAIQKGGDLYQNVTLDAGTYVLTFYAAQRTGNADNIPVVVSVDGTTISTLTAISTTYFSALQTASFTVTTGIHKIQLTTTQTSNDCTVFIDNVKIIIPSTFDSDKPSKTFSNNYLIDFSQPWDNTSFYNNWIATQSNIFTSADVANGYLQFAWISKRIISSKTPYMPPYVFETDIDYAAGSSRGGVVVRGNTTNIDDMQEPSNGDPGYNRQGIAFYPSDDGLTMNVKFSGSIVVGSATPASIISIPKPAGITNFRTRGKLRVEDFGNVLYVYYNNTALTRINLGGSLGNTYSSGTVYDANMNVLGTFANMLVPKWGVLSIAQRDASLRLYSVNIKNNLLVQQSISFTPISSKLITDAPFAVIATASSNLPVDLTLVSGPATINGNTITLTGKTGIVTLNANQAGNDIYNPAFETTISFYVSDSTLSNISPNTQDYVDNWIATDALGRVLPSYEVTGAKRTNKIVGVFYYIWHGAHGSKVHDITKIMASYPSNPLSASNPGWGAPGEFHFYAEPENGYMRSEDPWVLRRDLQMLSNAHVDFIYLDATNAVTYLETVKALCEVSLKMRADGIATPQIVFTTASNSGVTMNSIYDNFYALSLYNDLWFNWQGKPLILGDFNDTALRADVKNFFTIKHSWAWMDQSIPNQWSWLDNSPQRYGWTTSSSVPEQISVSVAQHPVSTIGSSYQNGSEPIVNSQYMTDFTGQGLYFDEQWKRALQVDPPMIMVTQWNEWMAQRFICSSTDAVKPGSTYAGRIINDGDTYFVDDLNEEFTRDMAPMKGGRTDNYYYQLISNIRKFKGMSAPQVFSTPTTMNMDGSFAEWANVTPIYQDPKGDTMHRNFAGYDPTTTFINNTGRNDIIESRTTYDANNIYFYVKTVDAISPSTDPNWMLLFIDADRSKGTGWEGYDYVVNLGVTSATQTTLKQWTGSAWGNTVSITYKVVGNEMELSIPRSLVQMTNGTPEFYFHWADNPQQLKDITAFFTDGESAPDRRFNYNFSTSKIVTLPETPYKTMVIPGTVEFEDFDNGGAGVAYADANLGNQGGAYRLNESVDIENTPGGGYDVTKTNTGEWLKYSVNVNVIGTVTASIKYASLTGNNMASISVDNVLKSDSILFPSTGDLQVYSNKNVDLVLKPGTHILTFSILKAADDFNLDKIVFTPKDVVYPGIGTGLSRSNWKGAAPGTWFKDSICSQVDPTIDEIWASTDSPGCSIPTTFWNVRWRGQLEPLYTETYTFYLTIKDLAKLWVNNQLLINQWTGSASGNTFTTTMNLTSGQKVPIQIDFAKKASDGKVKLEWSSQTNPREVIPMSQLYIATTTALQDIKNQSFEVYPNPMKDQFTINSGLSNVESIKLIDLQGRTVYFNTKNFSGSKTIDLKLAKGIYFLKLSGDITFETQKVVVE